MVVLDPTRSSKSPFSSFSCRGAINNLPHILIFYFRFVPNFCNAQSGICTMRYRVNTQKVHNTQKPRLYVQISLVKSRNFVDVAHLGRYRITMAFQLVGLKVSERRATIQMEVSSPFQARRGRRQPKTGKERAARFQRTHSVLSLIDFRRRAIGTSLVTSSSAW